MTPEQQKARRKRMYIYAGVGFFVIVIILLLAYRNKKDRAIGRRFRNPNEEEA